MTTLHDIAILTIIEVVADAMVAIPSPMPLNHLIRSTCNRSMSALVARCSYAPANRASLSPSVCADIPHSPFPPQRNAPIDATISQREAMRPIHHLSCSTDNELPTAALKIAYHTTAKNHSPSERRRLVVSGQWSVVSGQRSVVSGQWSVVSGQWSVVSGQWSVVSGQWSVVSGQWSVVSGQWSVVSGQ